MFDRNTLIALAIVGVILLLLPTYYKMISPPRPEQPAQSATGSLGRDTTAAVKEVDVATPIAQDSSKTAAASAASSAPKMLDTTPVDPDFVKVETPRFSLRIGSDGRVSSYKLKQYKNSDGTVLDLHLPPVMGYPEIGGIDFALGNYNPQSLAELRFQTSYRDFELTSGADSVILVRADSAGRRVQLTYIFNAEKYGFDVALATSGFVAPDVGEFEIGWNGGIPFTEESIRYPNRLPDPKKIEQTDHRYAAAFAKVGEELEERMGSDTPDPFSATGQTHFIAVRSKYFIAAIVPLGGPASGVSMKYRNYEPAPAQQHFYDVKLRQTWGQNAGGRWKVYWGPIHLNELKAENAGLEQMMNWGWAIIRPFSKAVLWSLTTLKTVIPNYGIVIILFSILVKIVLWPLTRKSQISMKKMAALQPQMQAIRDLHKNNPQAQQQAIMKMYKDSGVNPASGCIPLFLQMPVLYALYVIFASTIEFRQAPFMAWMSDLSRPDILFHLPFSIPLYGSGVAILPIIMGVSQFFMSKRTVTDPNQKAMLYIMPPLMVFMFNSLPSGLTLYYTMFNFLAIAEQNLIKLPDFTPSAVVVEEPKKKVKSK